VSEELLTEEWLKENGFKWHQLDRQPGKQWLLWLGDAASAGDSHDLGIEVSHDANDGLWFCWLRSDCAHRYSRFLHIRHIKTIGDLVAMIEGLTGQKFSRENNLYGVMHTAERAAKLRADAKRLDQRWMREGHPWREIEKDDSRGGALPEHMQDSITNGTSK